LPRDYKENRMPAIKMTNDPRDTIWMLKTKIKRLVIGISAGVLFSGAASAVNSPPPSLAGTSTNQSTAVEIRDTNPGSVRYVDFTVSTAGVFQIDAQGWDTLGDGYNWDPEIHLFMTSLDAANLVASDDDGGIGWLDSRILQALATGDYTLAVSEWSFDSAEAIAGDNASDVYDPNTLIRVTILSDDGIAILSGLVSLASLQAISQVVVSMPSLTLNGAHHRPLMMQKTGASGHCAWVNGDYAKFDDDDADNALFEIGGCKDFMAGQLRAGIGLGFNRISQDLAFSGNADIDGEYLLLELDYQAKNSPMIASVVGYYGKYDADIRRGYLTGAALDSSNGSADVDVWSIRARVDYPDIWSLGDASVTPYASFTVSHSRMDAYTETGGAAPASFNSRSHTARELRLGASVETVISERATVRGMLEGVHRFDGDVDGLSGVVGATSFSLTNEDLHQTWARIGAELDYELQKDVNLSATLFAATTGEDPDYSGAISLKFGF
jgi:hypothetical protein